MSNNARATHLRLGNVVYRKILPDTTMNPCLITPGLLDLILLDNAYSDANNNDHTTSRCFYVVTTGEWLVKLGFKKLPKHKNGDEVYMYRNIKSNQPVCMVYCIDGVCYARIKNKSYHFTYIHELQNLYMVLTGHEIIFPIINLIK